MSIRLARGIGSGASWTQVPFNASDFTGNGSMTWTVAEGDVIVHQYLVIGKVMHFLFDVNTTTVGGTPSTFLRIAMPGGFTLAAFPRTPIVVDDNTTLGTGMAEPASATLIGLAVNVGASANWQASTNLTRVWGNLAIALN